MPLSIFTTKNVGRANLVMFPIIAGMFAVFFFLTLYVQNILGYDPLKTGLAFLPIAIVIGIVAGIASSLVTKVGYKAFMVLGPLLIGGGMLWLSGLPVDGSYLANILPPLVLFATGMGLSFIGGTIAATNGVSARDSGLASGLLNTTQQIGGAVGLAVLSVVATSATKKYFENLHAQPTQADAVNGLLAGFQDAFLVAAGLCFTASLIALALIRQRKGEKIKVEMVPGA
jgi:MFS family permease